MEVSPSLGCEKSVGLKMQVLEWVKFGMVGVHPISGQTQMNKPH